MRWTTPNPKDRERKITRHFLWFPVEINYEVRWLEWANILWEWRHYQHMGGRWSQEAWANHSPVGPTQSGSPLELEPPNWAPSIKPAFTAL